MKFGTKTYAHSYEIEISLFLEGTIFREEKQYQKQIDNVSSAKLEIKCLRCCVRKTWASYNAEHQFLPLSLGIKTMYWLRLIYPSLINQYSLGWVFLNVIAELSRTSLLTLFGNFLIFMPCVLNFLPYCSLFLPFTLQLTDKQYSLCAIPRILHTKVCEGW